MTRRRAISIEKMTTDAGMMRTFTGGPFTARTTWITRYAASDGLDER
jgi:hypothetical protein